MRLRSPNPRKTQASSLPRALTLNRLRLYRQTFFAFSLQTSFQSGCEEMMRGDVSCAGCELEADAAAADADDAERAQLSRTPHRNSSQFTAN